MFREIACEVGIGISMPIRSTRCRRRILAVASGACCECSTSSSRCLCRNPHPTGKCAARASPQRKEGRIARQRATHKVCITTVAAFSASTPRRGGREAGSDTAAARATHTCVRLVRPPCPQPLRRWAASSRRAVPIAPVRRAISGAKSEEKWCRRHGREESESAIHGPVRGSGRPEGGRTTSRKRVNSGCMAGFG